MADDLNTAKAFANSWNHLPSGSVYTREQFAEWLEPVTPEAIAGQAVLELGCGNGSLLVHMAAWQPRQLVGVDLGSSVLSAQRNLAATGHPDWRIIQADLVDFESKGFDFVYSIGVLHHLQQPGAGFAAVLRNVKPGGRFHCWVYAREGNGIIIWVVDPIRRVASRLPWWVTKYLIATPLVAPYFLYARLLAALPRWHWLRPMPLYEYSLWIARREFTFFRHVAFDQLVTPQTRYLARGTIAEWLRNERIVDGTSYLIFRNGNSWKFGGRVR